MALAEEAFGALQAIVGPENSSREPAILESYNYYFMMETMKGSDGTKFTPNRPGAVVLPGSAEEVQKIIKVCNRFKLKSKAQSTNFGLFAIHQHADEVIIDLRRMNRILAIDEKNMYAIVEPYVSWAQLQAETMKLGLSPAIAGVGCHCSALANVSAVYGVGPYSWACGFGDKMPLSVEWVLPDGEMLNMGSLGSGSGWFCGDGPGPSLRGVMRGETGSLGGLGVVTKVAIKLFDMPGLTAMPIEGMYPSYDLTELPENFSVYLLTWNSREKRNQALARMGEEGIGLHLYAWGFAFMATSVPELEYLLPWKSGKPLPDEHVVAMTIAGNSPREKVYQEKVLKIILEETGGAPSALMDVPGVRQTILRSLVRPDFHFETVFRFASGWFDTLIPFVGVMDTVDKVHRGSVEASKEVEGAGVLPGCFDTSCEPIYDYGHTVYVEFAGGFYDAADPESVKKYREAVKVTNIPLINKQLQPPLAGPGGQKSLAGPLMSDFHIWQGKLKAAFDPNYVSDAFYYIEPYHE